MSRLNVMDPLIDINHHHHIAQSSCCEAAVLVLSADNSPDASTRLLTVL